MKKSILVAAAFLLALPALADDSDGFDVDFSVFQDAPAASPASKDSAPQVLSDEDADAAFLECLSSNSSDVCQSRGEALADVAITGGCTGESANVAKADVLTGDSGPGGATAGTAQ